MRENLQKDLKQIYGCIFILFMALYPLEMHCNSIVITYPSIHHHKLTLKKYVGAIPCFHLLHVIIRIFRWINGTSKEVAKEAKIFAPKSIPTEAAIPETKAAKTAAYLQKQIQSRKLLISKIWTPKWWKEVTSNNFQNAIELSLRIQLLKKNIVL